MSSLHAVEVLVSPGLAGKRLDQVIQQGSFLSRTQARRLIASGSVWVDGKRVKVAGRKMWHGQRVKVFLETEEGLPEAKLSPRILYQRDGLLVVDKPCGIPSTPTPRTDLTALTTLLQRQLHLEEPPSPITRLDRDTSGLMVLATGREAARLLSEAMKQGRAVKDYLAVCPGRPDQDRGEWTWPLARHPGRPDLRKVDPIRGRPATTLYTVEGPHPAIASAHTLRLRLVTGRTHQIRVHMSHAGFPVVGDRWYGGATRVTDVCGHPKEVSRLCLHSFWFELRGKEWPGPVELVCQPPHPFPVLENVKE